MSVPVPPPPKPRASVWPRMRAALAQVVTGDLRSLAVLRISLGLLILVDLIDRSRDLSVHYTDYGMLPRAALLSKFINGLAVCLHVCVGTWPGMLVLFVLQAAVACALLAGFHTRIMAVLSWFLMYSLHLRNPVVLQGGDDLLRMLLFWGMFLPLGARWSIDAACEEAESWLQDGAPPPAKPAGVVTWATVGALVQVVCIYWGTAIAKTGVEWHGEGSAVYYALQFDQLALAPALWLRNYYDVTVWLTHLTLFWEGYGPFFLLCPVLFGPVRTLAALMFVGMHFGFATFLLIGLFPWIDLASMVMLLPAWFWDKLEALRPPPAAVPYRIVVGVAPPKQRATARLICTVRMLLGLPHAPLAFAAGAADATWWLDQGDGMVVTGQAKWDVLIAASWLGPVRRRWPRLRLHPPARARLGHGLRALVRWAPRHTTLGRGRMTQSLAALALVVVGWWNLAAWPPTHIRFPDVLRPVTLMLRIDQYWGMFAPFPQKDDGWYVMPGHLVNGAPIEVWSGTLGSPSLAKPPLVSASYPNQRWSKYMMNLWFSSYSDYRLYLGQYLCRRYNGVNNVRLPTSLKNFEITYVKELTLPNYKVSAPTPVVIWKHYCFDMPKTP